MLGRDLEPVGAPLAKRSADREQVVTRTRELVVAPAPVGLGCRLDDAEPFKMLEPLREQSAGEPGRALQDLTEVSAAKLQVANDQRCPALGEDLGAAGDGAILAVRPHNAKYSAPAIGCEVQILDFTAAVRGCPMWPSRVEDTMMTTPTTTEVDHDGSKAPTVVEIDGFRGRLIRADDADYDSSVQSGTVSSTGARA